MARKNTDDAESKGGAAASADAGDGDAKSSKKKGKNDEPGESGNRLRIVGLGLIASIVVGFSPLRDAAQGNGSFENAMMRFLACFVVCVLAASIIGRILDGAPPPKPAGKSDEALAAQQDDTSNQNEAGSEPGEPGNLGDSSPTEPAAQAID